MIQSKSSSEVRCQRANRLLTPDGLALLSVSTVVPPPVHGHMRPHLKLKKAWICAVPLAVFQPLNSLNFSLQPSLLQITPSRLSHFPFDTTSTSIRGRVLNMLQLMDGTPCKPGFTVNWDSDTSHPFVGAQLPARLCVIQLRDQCTGVKALLTFTLHFGAAMRHSQELCTSYCPVGMCRARSWRTIARKA